MFKSPKTQKELNTFLLKPAKRSDAFVGSIEDYKVKFLEKVIKTDYCWNWIGAKHNFGYGILSIKKARYTSHQLSYLLYNGDINDNFVLHKCDNPNCVNPEHLFLGSQKDNIQDCIFKGRKVTLPSVGEKNVVSKLTTQDVISIRQLSINVDKKTLAKNYNVSLKTIYDVISGKAWNHIKEGIRCNYNGNFKKENNPNVKLNQKEVDLILNLYNNGIKQVDLAKRFNTSTSNINRICNRKSWKNI